MLQEIIINVNNIIERNGFDYTVDGIIEHVSEHDSQIESKDVSSPSLLSRFMIATRCLARGFTMAASIRLFELMKI